MASIPKKVAERFIKAVPRFQEILKVAKDRDVNESDTVAVLKGILGEVLGYDKYLEVTSEFAIRNTYCDLALKVDDKVQFLIEAKAIGIELKDNHIKQACDYGANHGVPWVVLTNGIDWRVYRIRFEQPISYDLVFALNFLSLDPRSENEQELLFVLAKEGLARNAREDFYEKAQNLNRYIIGNLILCEPVLTAIHRELKRLTDGMKFNVAEVEMIIRSEVLKREIVEGDEAEEAKARVIKFYRKGRVKKQQEQRIAATPEDLITDTPIPQMIPSGQTIQTNPQV